MRLLLCVFCFLALGGNSAVLFIEEPSNTFGLENQKLLLRCVYKSDKNASVTWFRNDEEVNPTTHEAKPSIESSDDGATVASLAFHLLRHTEGDYFCNVSASGFWLASRKASVRISFLGEQFVLEPQDKTVSVGETVLLECVPPIGLPRPLIQWYKDNVTVRSDERMQVSETGSLRIDRVSWKDAGLYMCVAESFAFRRYSSMAKLTVRQRPYFVESPLSQSVGIHGSFELSCRVAGEPMPMIFWRREPSFLEIPFDRTRLSLRGTLQFAHARLEDAGDYVCRAVSSAGVIEAVARISIVSPPGLVQTSPSTVSILEGEPVELPCSAVGSPSPEVRWIRKNPLIYYIAGSEDPSERILATRTGVLSISAARREDTSLYECRASSPAGLTRSITRLDVKENPYMYPARFGALSSGRISVPSGSSARITCEFPGVNGSSTVLSPGMQHNMGVSNSEGLSITWRINGGPLLQRLGAPNRTIVERSGSLVIHQAGKQDEGNYTCLIFNKISRRYTSWTTQLLVDQRNTHSESQSHTMLPEATKVPFNLTVIGKGDTWLMIQWSDVLEKRYDFHGYRVFYLPVMVGFRRSVALAGQDTELSDVVGKRKAKSSPSFDAWLSLPELLQHKQARLIRLTPNTGYWVEVRKTFKYGYGVGALLPRIVYTLSRPSEIRLASGVSGSSLVSSNAEYTLDVPFGSGSSAADFQGLLSNFQTITFHDVSVRSLTSTELVISWATRSSINILQQIDGFKVNIKPVPMSRCISTVTSTSANRLSFSYSDGQNSLKFIRRNERKDWPTHPMHCSLSSDDLLERIMRMPNGPVSTDAQVTRADDSSSKPSPHTVIVMHGVSQVNSVTRAIVGGLVPFTCYELDVEAFKDDAAYGRISSPASRPELALTLDAPPSHAPKLMTVDWISDAVDLATNFTPTIPNGVRLSWSPLELRLSHGVLVGYVLHFLSNQSDHSRSFKVPADVHTRDVFGLDPHVEYTIYLAGVTCRGEGVRGPGYRLFPASSLFQSAYGEATHPANILSTKSKFPPWGYGIIIGVIVIWIFFGSMIPILTRRSPVKQSTDSNRSFDPRHPEIDRCWHWCIFCGNSRSDLKRGSKAPTIDNPLARKSDSNSSYTFATAVHRDQMELANLLQRTDSHQTSASEQHGGDVPGDHRQLPGGYSTSGSNSRGDPSMRQLPVQPEKSNYLAGDDAEVYANSDPSLVSDPANSLIIQNSTSSGPMYHLSTAAVQTPQQVYWNRPQLPDSVNVPFPVPPSYPFSDPTSPNSLKAFPTPDLSGEVTSGFVSQSGRPSHDTFTQLNGSDHQDVCTEDSVPPYASCSVLSAPRLQYISSDLSQPYNLGTNKPTEGECLSAALRGPSVMSKSVSGQNVTGGLMESGRLDPVATRQWPITSRLLPSIQPSHCTPYTASNGGPQSIPPPPEYPPPPLPTANQWVYPPVHQTIVYPHSPGTGHSSCVTPEYEGHVLRGSDTSALVSIEPAHHYSSSGVYARTQQEQPVGIPYLNNGLHPVSGSRFPQMSTVEASACLQRPSMNQAHLHPTEMHPSGLLKLDRMKPRSFSAQRLEKSATPITRGGNSSTCGGGSSSGRSTTSVIGSCGKNQCPRASNRDCAVSSLSGSDSSGSGLNAVHHNPAIAPSRLSSMPAQSSVATSVLQHPPAPADRFTIGLDQFSPTVFGHINQLPLDAVTRGMRDNSSCSPQPAQSVNKASRHISGSSNPQPPIGPDKGFQNSLIVCNPRHQPVTGPGLSPATRPAGPPDIDA
ncbi:hypothetical protein T265_10976 [Opisthorchis viverrini]|uniref:Fibronectin type III domain protein n=2 Tax=Opisthorchis viverrini TaxID=6198 RepID=A0A074ZB85_OPIVI|nr:hypothetical protein T265_10976 [Opisthorchis viverrini]KER20490.1 hypothetical protein T265_10976 [Opisthorchis viverrini]